ncbi:e1-E2 ATPase, partial [Teladorsagia circumcincta]
MFTACSRKNRETVVISLARDSFPNPEHEPKDHSREYGCTLVQLRSLMEARGAEAIVRLSTEHEGVEGLCQKLKVDPLRGLPNSPVELDRRRATFGANTIPPAKSKSFTRLVFDACRDPTLIILVVSGFINLALSFYEPDIQSPVDEDVAVTAASVAGAYLSNNTIGFDLLNSTLFLNATTISPPPSEGHGTAWIEGVAILLCVVVVVLVTAGNDYSKERQFRSLQEKIETGQKFSVIRDGEAIDVPVSDLVVGDIARVKYGDLLPADGFLLQGNDLKIDESSLTGESDHIKKTVESDPVLLSGTYAMEGSGKMVLTAVGVNSQTGIIMTLLGSGKPGVAGVDDNSTSTSSSSSSSSSSSDKSSSSNSSNSTDDDDLSAKSVLQSKLSQLALQIIYCGNHYEGQDNQPNGTALPGNTTHLICEAISVNSAYNSIIVEPTKAGEQVQQLGNKTECGLLGFVQRLGGDYSLIRKDFPEEALVKVYTFNSSRKCMMTVVNLVENGINVGYRVYCKGASEIILA